MKRTRFCGVSWPRGSLSGFTILEVVVVITVISLLVALVVPAVLSARDSARRIDCANRMHQIGLALQEFESAWGSFPSADPDCDKPNRATFRGYRSWQLQLLPYLEQAAVFEKLNNSRVIYKVTNHLMFELPVLHCPSDSVTIGMNYRFCAGRNCSDVSYYGSAELTKGFGVCSFRDSCRGTKASDITDGLSNTILMSERTLSEVDSSRYNRYRDLWFSGAIELGFDPLSRTANDAADICAAAPQTTSSFYFPFVGYNLVQHGMFNSAYSHVLPPNSKIPDCSLRSNGGADPQSQWGLEVHFAVVSARSLHRDSSVNTLNADGSVRAVSQNIDLTMWRSMSTMSDRD